MKQEKLNKMFFTVDIKWDPFFIYLSIYLSIYWITRKMDMSLIYLSIYLSRWIDRLIDRYEQNMYVLR